MCFGSKIGEKVKSWFLSNPGGKLSQLHPKCWCCLNLGCIAILYMHNCCFAGAFKFKQDNTSKPGICLHQIGGDC